MYQDAAGGETKRVTVYGLRAFTTFWTHTMALSRISPNRRPSLRRAESSFQGKFERNLDDPEILARPLFLVLDTLAEPQSELFAFTAAWLQTMSDMNM